MLAQGLLSDTEPYGMNMVKVGDRSSLHFGISLTILQCACPFHGRVVVIVS